MDAIIARVLNLIGEAIMLLASGDYAQTKLVLRKAANQLDEIS